MSTEIWIVCAIALVVAVAVLADYLIDARHARNRATVDPYREHAPNDGNLLLLRMRARRHAMGSHWIGHGKSTYTGTYL